MKFWRTVCRMRIDTSSHSPVSSSTSFKRQRKPCSIGNRLGHCSNTTHSRICSSRSRTVPLACFSWDRSMSDRWSDARPLRCTNTHSSRTLHSGAHMRGCAGCKYTQLTQARSLMRIMPTWSRWIRSSRSTCRTVAVLLHRTMLIHNKQLNYRLQRHRRVCRHWIQSRQCRLTAVQILWIKCLLAHLSTRIWKKIWALLWKEVVSLSNLHRIST